MTSRTIVHVQPQIDQLLCATADFMSASIKESIALSGKCAIALAGGNSPRRLYEMMTQPRYSQDWGHVSFFFSDERYVAADHPDSNFGMAYQTLLQPLGISGKNIFPVNTRLPPQEAAADYENRIQHFFDDSSPVFDIILLGVGDNAHTASLFPHTSVLEEKTALVKEVYVKDVNGYRITFTAPLINKARKIVFLVYGSSKATALYHILEDTPDYKVYPAQLIAPVDGEVHWFIDEAAASMIGKSKKGHD
jgi:6-phosphogluconolactonase